MATVCDVVVEVLASAGVRHIFGVPGDAINQLTESIRRQDAIRFIHVNHEETGAFAACAQAKLTGGLGVCCGTAGPGAIHLLNGLYDAKCDHAPVLAITGQVETRFAGSDYQQEIDLHTLFQDVAVYNQTVTNPDQMPYMIVRAIREAFENRGVAHVNIPLDLAGKSVSHTGKWKWRPALSPPAQVDPQSLSAAVQLLDRAEKVAILAGIGCLGAEQQVFALAEKLGAPIVHALRGKEIFPEDHPYSIGGIGNLGVPPAYEALKSCNALLLIGTDFPYFDYLEFDAKAVQIDIDARQIGKRYPVEVGLIGDARSVTELLLERVQRKEKREYLATAQKRMEKWRMQQRKDVSDMSSPIKPQRLAYLVGAAAPDDAIFVCDTGEVTAWTARYLQMRPGQRFIVSGLLASMAFALPASIGAQLAYPHRKVVALAGDGGFSMLMTDFSTAVRLRLPIVFVIFNNRRLGMIQIEQESRGMPNYETADFNPDFGAFARICGGDGARVEDPAALEDAIASAFASPKPFVLDVRIDPDEIPMPPRVTLMQGIEYGKAKLKELLA